MNKIIQCVTFLLVFATACSAQNSVSQEKVLTGASQVNSYLKILKNKNVAIVANQTSTIGSTHIVDTLLKLGVNVQVIFAPEHGFRGKADAGENVNSGVDKETNVKVISLYGEHNKPNTADLQNIGIVVFDIQDVGARYYTYISTLQYVMESCAENNIPLLILDRPNPHSGYIDGPVLDPKFKSFVGMQSIPVVYAMTIAEYAQMLNGEHLLKDGKVCELKIIKLLNWSHSSNYILPISPSPNLPNQIAVNLYPSLCFFEGTKISMGRGTQTPFQIIGYPGYKDGDINFKPINIPGKAVNPLYLNVQCEGKNIALDGNKAPKQVNLSYLLEMYKSYPNKSTFFNNFFDILAGSAELKKQIENNKSEEEIRLSWIDGIKSFKMIRKKYLLYKDFE